jgi:hypothetical protein
MPTERKKIPTSTRIAILTEAGYRCSVPTCRTILAIDLHHVEALEDGGSDDASNLIALCPTCHRLYHRGTIDNEAIKTWKHMLVALSNAFDKQAMDDLIFLSKIEQGKFVFSSDGVLKFSRLIAAGLAEFKPHIEPARINILHRLDAAYDVRLTDKGKSFVNAWKAGDSELLKKSLLPPDGPEPVWLS